MAVKVTIYDNSGGFGATKEFTVDRGASWDRDESGNVRVYETGNPGMGSVIAEYAGGAVASIEKVESNDSKQTFDPVTETK